MQVIKFLQKYMVGIAVMSWVIVISGAGVIYFHVKDELPQIPKNLRYLNQQPPTEIYSRDGKVLKILGDRSYMTLDLISPHFQKAIIAVEDSTFYEHHGLDPVAILRALYKNTVKGKTAQGGSTITQQLAKNLFFSFEKSLNNIIYMGCRTKIPSISKYQLFWPAKHPQKIQLSRGCKWPEKPEPSHGCSINKSFLCLIQ